VAAPVRVGEELVGVVALSRTPREEIQALYQMIPAWGAALALVVTLTVAWGSGRMGTRSLVRLSAVARRIAGGAVTSLGDLLRPEASRVREVGALAQSISGMAARLEARLAYIGEFAGNVSHEFRTPISTLRGTVELLRDDTDMPAEQRATFLENALQDLDRMDRLVTGLLALARAEQLQGAREVSLSEVIAAVAGRYPGVTTEGSAGVVQGDPAQLETALTNLVQNALRYGGTNVQVRMVGWASDDTTGIDVLDDGPGISEKNVPRIFDRFFTTDRAGGGTGLGLALVRAIAAAHGGQVTVESGAGRTCFRVSLPVRR
jgi:signal transduction histidine kinase